MKKTISKVKRQPSDWEKIIANKTTNKERINIKNIQAAHAAQYQKNKRPNQKWARELNRHFSREDIQMANKHMERCSASLIIRGMKTKSTMRYRLMPVRTAAIKKSINNKCWRGCGEKGALSHSWWECKLGQPLWKKNCHMTQQSHCWACTSRKPEFKETCAPQCSLQHCLQ